MSVIMTDPELRLLVAACNAAFNDRAPPFAEYRTLDWQRLSLLAARHRVDALCWDGLQRLKASVPPATASSFKDRTARIVDSNLRATAECSRLRSDLERAGISCLFLKGLTIASLAYPQPFLKASWDIDLLIAPDSLPKAAQLLGKSGYVPFVPASNDLDRLGRWHSTRKESSWSNAQGGFVLDLHTGLTDNPAMIPGVGLFSPSQMVPITGAVSLPTLAKDELFAYLCVHGASSAWFRLKWVCDIAAILHREGPDEIERLYERSQVLGAGRSTDQALLLADSLFGLALTSELRSRLRISPIGRWLASLARSQLEREIEPTDRFLGTASIHYSQLFLQPSAHFMLSEAARQFRNALGSAA